MFRTVISPSSRNNALTVLAVYIGMLSIASVFGSFLLQFAVRLVVAPGDSWPWIDAGAFIPRVRCGS